MVAAIGNITNTTRGRILQYICEYDGRGAGSIGDVFVGGTRCISDCERDNNACTTTRTSSCNVTTARPTITHSITPSVFHSRLKTSVFSKILPIVAFLFFFPDRPTLYLLELVFNHLLTHSFKALNFPFLHNPSHRSLPFILPDRLHRFPNNKDIVM